MYGLPWVGMLTPSVGLNNLDGPTRREPSLWYLVATGEVGRRRLLLPWELQSLSQCLMFRRVFECPLATSVPPATHQTVEMATRGLTWLGRQNCS